MDKKTRAIIIIGCIVTFIVVPAVTVFLLSKNQPAEPSKNAPNSDDSSNTKLPDRSNAELAKAIATQKTDLTDNGEPIFAIKAVARPITAWYIVTIHLIDDPEGNNPAKMLLHDSGDKSGGLRVLLGPGTSFPEESTETIGVPDVVARELNK
jgi:hypothetical protein